MDPVVLAIDPQRGLIHMQRGHGQQLSAGLRLSAFQGVMEAQDEAQQGPLRQ